MEFKFVHVVFSYFQWEKYDYAKQLKQAISELQKVGDP